MNRWSITTCNNLKSTFSILVNVIPRSPSKMLVYSTKFCVSWFTEGLLELQQMQRRTTGGSGETSPQNKGYKDSLPWRQEKLCIYSYYCEFKEIDLGNLFLLFIAFSTFYAVHYSI